MNIPSPAAVKKLIDQKKALESYETPESSPSVSSKTASKPSQKRGSTSTGSNRGTSSTTKPKTQSRKPSSKVTKSSSGSGVTDIPSTPVRQQPSKAPVSTPKAKKPFVRPEHLTQPLRDNPVLKALAEAEQSKVQNLKKENN